MIRMMLLVVTVLASQVGAVSIPEVEQIGRCQKGIASAGAKFALKTIRATLRCTNAVTECQVQCDYGVFGPSCNTSAPPCCDSDDTSSNSAFGLCMLEANSVCTEQTDNIAEFEASKQARIIASCSSLTQEQLCGANGDGLNFALPSVTVGGKACPVVTALLTSTIIECTLPGGSGTVDVVVTNSGNLSYTFKRGYRFITGHL